MAFCGLFVTVLLLSWGLCSSETHERDSSLSTDEPEVGQQCDDKQSCLELQLSKWFAPFLDQKHQSDCDGGAAEADVTGGSPVFTLAKSCDEEGAIWHYKYSGGKGKKKIFHGKGKLLFSKSSSPPHGYDYGMKSGRCVLLGDKFVKGIDGTFEQGVLQGEAQVSFHNGQVLRGKFKDGIPYGFVRKYETEKDKNTNMDKPEKRLCELSVYKNGKPDGGQWTLREDGTRLYRPIGEDGDETLAVVPRNGSFFYVVGKLDEDDMLVGARRARLAALEDRVCMTVPAVEPYGEKIDYDLEIKAEVNAATAKFVRFFELVANEDQSLYSSNFQQSSVPVDAKSARKLLDIAGSEVTWDNRRVFNVLTHDGNGKGVTDGMKMQRGNLPEGPHTIKMLTEWKRRDIMPIASKMKKEREEEREKKAKEHRRRAEEEVQREVQKEAQAMTKQRRGAEEGGGEAVEGEEDDGDTNTDEDDEALDNLLLAEANRTAQMKAEDYEKYLDELVPFDSLPFRPLAWAKKIVSIMGFFDGEGKLQGAVTVKYGDGTSLEGFVVDGVLHGPARHLDAVLKKGKRKRYVRRQVENVVVAAAAGGMMSKADPIREVNFVGSYRNGYIDGPGWQFLVGGTFLYGELDRTLEFTTDKGAFINQDLESCYYGKFKDGKMLAGQVARVVGGKEHESKVKMPVFSEPEGTVYRFVEQERGKLVDPTVPDPTEEAWVYVGESAMGPDVGQGLFAKREVPENTVVAFYGGMRFNASEWNQTKPLDASYWMKVEDGRDVMFLPDDVGADVAKYRATLAHKINHSFTKWNCMFHSLDHPRFGLIPAARTVETVSKDEELVCLYDLPYHEAAPWYQELWRREIDDDFVYGPFGHRMSGRRNESEDIGPWLSNGTLYREFYRHAVEVLGLEPTT